MKTLTEQEAFDFLRQFAQKHRHDTASYWLDVNQDHIGYCVAWRELTNMASISEAFRIGNTNYIQIGRIRMAQPGYDSYRAMVKLNADGFEIEHMAYDVQRLDKTVKCPALFVGFDYQLMKKGMRT